MANNARSTAYQLENLIQQVLSSDETIPPAQFRRDLRGLERVLTSIRDEDVEQAGGQHHSQRLAALVPLLTKLPCSGYDAEELTTSITVLVAEILTSDGHLGIDDDASGDDAFQLSPSDAIALLERIVYESPGPETLCAWIDALLHFWSVLEGVDDVTFWLNLVEPLLLHAQNSLSLENLGQGGALDDPDYNAQTKWRWLTGQVLTLLCDMWTKQGTDVSFEEWIQQGGVDKQIKIPVYLSNLTENALDAVDGAAASVPSANNTAELCWNVTDSLRQVDVALLTIRGAVWSFNRGPLLFKIWSLVAKAYVELDLIVPLKDQIGQTLLDLAAAWFSVAQPTRVAEFRDQLCQTVLQTCNSTSLLTKDIFWEYLRSAIENDAHVKHVVMASYMICNVPTMQDKLLELLGKPSDDPWDKFFMTQINY